MSSKKDYQLLMEAALQLADAFKNFLILAAAALIQAAGGPDKIIAAAGAAEPDEPDEEGNDSGTGVETATAGAAVAGKRRGRKTNAERAAAAAALAAQGAAGGGVAASPGVTVTIPPVAGPVTIPVAAPPVKAEAPAAYETHLRPWMLKLAEAKGMQVVEAFLKTYNATTAKDIPVTSYERAIAEIQAHIAGTPPAPGAGMMGMI